MCETVIHGPGGGSIRINYVSDDPDVHPMDALVERLKRASLNRNDPKRVKLRNPPRPFIGPVPRVTLPFDSFPHILECVVAHAGKELLWSLRATCKKVCALVDRRYAEHIEVYSTGLDLGFDARHLGPIPGFRFRGPITIGVGLSEELAAILGHTQEERELRFASLLRRLHWDFDNNFDVWLRVPEGTVEWFKNFISKVKWVDMDEAILTTILPATRAAQEGKDPYERVFIDKLPVPLMRMYPSADGSYANYVPFTPKYVQHSVQLQDPTVAPEKTWLTALAYVPEGATQYQAVVHLWHTLNLATFCPTHPIVYPTSLKKVVLRVILHPPGAAPTLESFESLLPVLRKLFAGFRPGIQFFILNIHEWDQLNYVSRETITEVFARMWLGDDSVPKDIRQVASICAPHLKFARGEWMYTEKKLRTARLKADGTPMTKEEEREFKAWRDGEE